MASSAHRLLLFAVVIGVAAACGSAGDERDPVPAERLGPFPVVDVVDGDTLKVDAPERVTVRVIGIDTPETVDPRRPVQCLGLEASARARQLLDGQSVTLEYDPTQGERDRYGRTLAYVWLPDGASFGETLIREGYAQEYTYDTPYRYQDEYRDAEADARDNDRGLWAPGVCP